MAAIVIKVKSDKRKRTFTVRKFQRGKCFAKYRTSRMSAEEFEVAETHTESDWVDFLKRGDYQEITKN